MKKITLVLILVLSVMMLAGCSNKKNDETTAAATEAPETEAPSTAAAEETEPETEAKETRPGYVRSHLTGQWIEEDVGKKRPIAVMINNIEAALPQSGISQADIIYECMVEGSITRLMAIFQDVDGVKKIGPVRSARTYYVYLANEWNAFYFHYGQCNFAWPYLDAYITQNVNGAPGRADRTDDSNVAFFRTDDRPVPHNAYTSGEIIEKTLERKAESAGYIRNLDEFYATLQNVYNSEIEPEYTEHFKFAKDDEIIMLDGGMAAENIEVGFSYNHSSFTYDSSTNKYLHNQYGGKHIDQENGEQLAFDNVIIIYSEKDNYPYDPGKTIYLKFDLWSGGDGYYMTHGKAIPIHWDTNTEWGPMFFQDEDGNEITINQGKTWISIVPTVDKDKTVIE